MSWRPRRFDKSLRFNFRCDWRSTAFRIRSARSSGIENFVPRARMISVTVLPVARRTFGTAYWSRRTPPISAERFPCAARRATVSSISSPSRGTQSGLFVTRGRFDPDRPFRRACMRAMMCSERRPQAGPRIYPYPCASRLLDEERGVILLVRIELRLLDDTEAFGGDVRAPGLHDEEAEPARPQEAKVLREDRDLVPLRDVLVQRPHGTHEPFVRRRRLRVREDRHDVRASLRQLDQLLE